MKQPLVSIIIVTHNSTGYLDGCLASLKSSRSKISYQVIVVSNGAEPLPVSFCRKHSQVTFLQPPDNHGFGSACNLGVSLARGQYLFFLNPDTELKTPVLRKLINAFKHHPHAGVIAPFLLDSSHTPYPLQGTADLNPVTAIFSLSFIHRLFPGNPIARRYWLQGVNRSRAHQVSVVPGSAFMVKKSVFTKVGGFDENFFLYFEESDLCRRIKKLGYQLFIEPQAQVVHFWGKSTESLDINTNNRYFTASRYYYFRKHFGFLPAAVTETVLGFSAKHFIFLLIIGLAAFGRFYRLQTLMPFIGDFGRDFLAARMVILDHKLPLLGIPSSVPRFHQGPLYIWFLTLVLGLAQFDPLAGGLLAATLGLLAVGGTYLLLDARSPNSRHSALAAFLLATSPLAILHSRMPFHTNAIPLFSLFYLYALSRLAKNHSFLLAGLTFALLFQFELVAAPLLLLIPFVVFRQRIKLRPTHHLLLISGLFLGLLPQFLFDLTHRFAQLGTFIVWVGYRIVSFTGIIPEHAASIAKFTHVLNITAGYAQKFFSWQLAWSTLLLIGVSTFGLVRFHRRLNSFVTLNLIWVGLLLVSFFILGNASEAYFPLLFVPMVIVVAWAILQFNLVVKSLLVAFVLILGLFNLSATISHDFYQSTARGTGDNPFGTYGPPLGDQLQAVSLIGSLGKSVNLHSTDPGSEFESHLDNYRYLLAISGTQLDSDGVDIWIYHRSTPFRPLDSKSVSFGAITISYPFHIDDH